MRALVPLILLCATAGAAEVEPNVGLIVWSDGATEADAQKAGERWASFRVQSTQPLVKLRSNDVPGLRPNLWINALGVCPVADGEALVRRLRRATGSTTEPYVRIVPLSKAIGRLRCPEITLPDPWLLECDGDTHELTHVETAHDGELLLTVSATLQGNCDGEYASSSWHATATLEKKGVRVDQTESQAADFADILELRAKGKTITLVAKESTRSCNHGATFDTQTIQRVWTTHHGKLVMKRTALAEERGLCGPAAEGKSACKLAPEIERYEALRGSCTGALSTCERAISAYDKEHAQDEPPDCEGQEE